MRRTAYASVLGLTLASLAAAQTKQTLLFTNRYDVESLDATAPAVLKTMRAHDVCAVTPGAGATAFNWLPSTTVHARAGDADANGSLTQLAGLAGITSGIAGPFVKWADKSKADPRLMYWTIKRGAATGYQPTVWAANKAFQVREGDFVRFLDDGEVEFFITQELVMKAAGTQTGTFIPGCNTLCQDKDGNLYYAGPNQGSNGHWIDNKPLTRQFLYDGGVAKIPASAITYDAKGNVSDVQAGSATLVFNEIGVGPTGEPNLRVMTQNSGALDDLGFPTIISFWIGGLDIDPLGGTFNGWDGKAHPNLIFHVVRTAYLTEGSWKGTIFSTRPRNSQLGTLATINGVEMGTRTGMADASWLGLANGKSTVDAPLLAGLCVLDTTWSSVAPYGASAGNAARDGVVKIGTDPSIDFAIQGPSPRFPIAALSLGVGVAKGGKLVGIDFSGQLGGYMSFYPPIAGWIIIPGGATDGKGQIAYSLPTPNDTNLKGVNLLWQGLCLRIGGAVSLTNPFVTEFQ